MSNSFFIWIPKGNLWRSAEAEPLRIVAFYKQNLFFKGFNTMELCSIPRQGLPPLYPDKKLSFLTSNLNFKQILTCVYKINML